MSDDLLTLDQLQGIQTDPEAETKVAQALGIPGGTYNSVPELSLTLRVAGDEALHPGRRSARLYGFFKGQGVREDPRDAQSPLIDPQPAGRAGFDLSWEYHDKVDFQTKEVEVGKPDNPSKLWHQACQTYRVVNGLPRKAIVEVPDVLTFLQKYAVAARFIYLDGRDEPLAVSISRAKESL